MRRLKVSIIMLDNFHTCSMFLMENCSLPSFKLVFRFSVQYRVGLSDHEFNLVVSVIKICGFAFVAGVQENQSNS